LSDLLRPFVPQMVRVSADTDDPAERFVLLRVARDIAAASGDIAGAMDAIGRLDRRFQVDAFGMQVDALRTANNANVPAPVAATVARGLLAVAADAAWQDRFDTADELLASARSAARKARDAELTKRIIPLPIRPDT